MLHFLQLPSVALTMLLRVSGFLGGCCVPVTMLPFQDCSLYNHGTLSGFWIFFFSIFHLSLFSYLCTHCSPYKLFSYLSTNSSFMLILRLHPCHMQCKLIDLCCHALSGVSNIRLHSMRICNSDLMLVLIFSGLAVYFNQVHTD
jgi:hypothetical protein